MVFFPNDKNKNNCPCEEKIQNELFIKCSLCDEAWHVSCVGLTEITSGALSKLVSWNCPLCITLPQQVQSKLEEKIRNDISPIKKIIRDMEQNLIKKLDEVKKNPAQPTSFKDISVKNLEKKVTETNNLVKSQLRQNIEEEKEKIIRVAIKPKDIEIRNSRDLHAKFSTHFPNIYCSNARISVAGSFVFEFEDIEAANQLEQEWSKEFFGGNDGLIKPSDKSVTGIVKNVWNNLSEEEMADDIETNYPGVKYEFFKKENKFTGMIKVTFSESADLVNAISNKFHIDRRKYPIEEFKHKPRIIKCNICQMFGHVSLRCRNKQNKRCGKCSEKGHETKDCTANDDEIKCCHCEQTNHFTGSFSCPKVQEKCQQLLDRRNNGY